MTTPRVILLGLILGMVLCWYMASRAHAETFSVPSTQVCAPDIEMNQTLSNLGAVEVMGGTAGEKADNLGEVWVNPKTKFWVFVQRIPDAGISCVVLGGEQMTTKGIKT